jgi:hypothetical protein
MKNKAALRILSQLFFENDILKLKEAIHRSGALGFRKRPQRDEGFDP